MKENSEISALIRQWMEAFFVRSMQDSKVFFKATGLSMPQFSIMMHLFYRGMRGVHDIGDRMEITSAAASQLIDRLVQAGLVERAESPDDRRVRRIALTDKGRALIEKGISERYRWVEGLVTGLTEDQKEAVLKVLPTLMEAERKLTDQSDSRHCVDHHHDRAGLGDAGRAEDAPVARESSPRNIDALQKK
jgi:DNA-binding MarR family transcriptional regulator